ncbi:DUF1553 domain-containing protein, partial [bacterium]|nr:DUF1553 domain-containing protein [bacterium]
MRELAALEDPRMREVNEQRGDDHGVNLTHLRELAKRLKTQHELALQLWATGNTVARLLATLVCKPKALSPAELDAMARDFTRNGFDLKFLYKSILLSRTYQRTSKPTGGNEADEVLFSHMAVKVMSPEQLFDSLTQATGVAQQMAARQARNPMAKGQPNGPRDQFVQFFLAGADATNATEYEAGIPQALRLMNSKQYAGNPGSVRLYAVTPRDEVRAVLERMYLATLSRRPTAAELARLSAYVQSAGTQVEGYGDVLWAILNSSEFTMIKLHSAGERPA